METITLNKVIKRKDCHFDSSLIDHQKDIISVV